MPKFQDISISIYVILIFILIFQFYYTDSYHKRNPEDHSKHTADYHKFKMNMQQHKEETKQQPATTSAMIKSIKTGFLRGLLLGLVTFSFEGALAGGFLYAIINPIVLGFDHKL
mgnify:CR=1 FL=1